MLASITRLSVLHRLVNFQVRSLAYRGEKFDVTQEVKVKELIATLKNEERQLLYNKLRQVLLEEEKLRENYVQNQPSKLVEWFASKSGHFRKYIVKPTSSQLISLFVYHSLPYLAFGTMDNCIMILAGDYIQTNIGSVIGLSTITSAALGNTLANSSSIAAAYYVERFFTKRIQGPSSITIGQFQLKRTRLVIQSARILGIVCGCILGMTPLLFIK